MGRTKAEMAIIGDETGCRPPGSWLRLQIAEGPLDIHIHELLKERPDLLRTCADLSAEHRLSLGVADADGNLLAVLIDGEVQHRRVLLVQSDWCAHLATP